MTTTRSTPGFSSSMLVLTFGAAFLHGILPACSIVCTGDHQTECVDALHLQFSQELSDGSYLVEVISTDAELSCAVKLPEKSIDCAESSGEPSLQIEMDASWLTIQGSPETVTVRITNAQSGQTTEEHYSPQYQEQFPNGTECPPVCMKATGTFAFIAS